ncbi:glycosyltransferase family 2 protein [Brachyspira murdochii]|uniref:glycosyltransferase family 2 protein n=1 Tax=Brachyspira murdochii TaxID=84378 RepID=UPI0012F4F391|nr:glycosyltransferase family 2 protein [Brachyspira murdochii]
MDEKIIKDIDNIVWWIPFKKLRNSLRNYLLKINNNINILNDNLNILYNKTNYMINIQNINAKNIRVKINDSLYTTLLNYDQSIYSSIKPPYISIIVPIYNINKEHLINCLNSLINQTLKEIEIILVNDCSTNEENDLICSEYALKDQRIKYIKHKENKGSGGARMTGLKISKGYAISFVDADDMLSYNACEIALVNMIKNNVDIVAFDFYWVENREYYYVSEHRYDNNFIYGKFIFETLCTKEKIFGQLWDKIYKRDFLIKLGDDLIPEKISGQDQVASFKIMYNADSFMYVPLVLYHHNRHRSSITNTCNEQYIKDRYQIVEYLYEYSKKNNILDLYSNFLEKYIVYTIFISTSNFIIKKLYEEPNLSEQYNKIFKEFILFCINKNYISIQTFNNFINVLSSGEISNNCIDINYLLGICNMVTNILNG